MSASARAESGAREPVRLVSIPYTGFVHVTFLGDIEGSEYHLVKARPFHCLGGEVCPIAIHRQPLFWRGYAPIEAWVPRRECWVPAVLEVTESLGEQLQGYRLRGKQYRMTRSRPNDKTSPVQAFWESDIPQQELTPAFDLALVLKRLWHIPQVRLGVELVLPERVALPSSKRSGPSQNRQSQSSAAPPPSAEQFERMRQQARTTKPLSPNSNPSGDR